jgi:uncharacterized protein YecT (DUF1311 family)
MLVRMKAALLSVALLALCSTASFAQLEDANSDTHAKCQEYVKTPLPPDVPQLPVPGEFPKCSSLSLYYGEWDSVPNFKAAADCAWKERAYLLSDRGRAPVDVNTPISLDQIEGGSLTLAMIYANGIGVTRNVVMALRFVCEAESSDSVIDYALEELEREAKAPAPATMKDYFTMCRHQGGTPEADLCAEWDEQVENAQRKSALAKIVSSWKSDEEKKALARLEVAADRYFHTHAAGELNRAGTIRGIQAMEELGSFRDEFVKDMRQLREGWMPKSGHTDYLRADHDLNLTYRALMAEAKAHEAEYGTVEPEDVQSTERAWIEYRDRWVGFAALVRPDVSADCWLTWLTRRRMEVLKNTALEVGSGF